VPVGILGYINDQPIAWCSVAPRETYQRLGGEESLENVWSIACFYISKEFRNRGIVGELIEKAKEYAKSNGAKYLEAYPVEPDSPSYRFMGFIGTFENAGFTKVKMAGSRRHVMILPL
jgi:ribosomal protein S18 acetylase RimI-like enzyme